MLGSETERRVRRLNGLGACRQIAADDQVKG
jgi:hypothetical protein